MTARWLQVHQWLLIAVHREELLHAWCGCILESSGSSKQDNKETMNQKCTYLDVTENEGLFSPVCCLNDREVQSGMFPRDAAV
ncbi:hypothetical protein BD289DRAFT_113567 [Coniella lustricola]|uniref:PH domain-containing protein n=1 Tax=Coniella lustricola TaxID=2025994 RepID=A0A2T3AGE2_9PEZI|nr:hypothetical protein BD289DRAFT_113567 [Coniella lustricola]